MRKATGKINALLNARILDGSGKEIGKMIPTDGNTAYVFALQSFELVVCDPATGTEKTIVVYGYEKPATA